ncbi:hypothetical protein WJX74_003228 [Apatococcus lobatus]|uniref:Mini-chromosome maintenance complex-binding protein n=1 Tax=Apatococcus lobatus TaxID=904363 RepID=A0AAW1QH70_9CHLO
MAGATKLQEVLGSLPQAFEAIPDQNTFYRRAEQELRRCLADQLLQVFPLNGVRPEILQSGSLVRFAGMVQDMPDPEYFLGAYSDSAGAAWQTTAFSDAAVPSTSEHRAIWERKPLLCIPVPGQNTPRATASAVLAGSTDTKGMKRGRDEEGSAMECDGHQADAACGAQQPIGKQQRSSEAAVHTAPAGSPANPADYEGACMVYLHGDASCAKLNSVIHAVGVLSLVPDLAQVPDDGPANELATPPLPTSLVPRLHAILVEPESSGASQQQWSPEQIKPQREATLELLTSVCGGDALAAEYLLLQLVSKVTRHQEGDAVGTVCLNLTRCPGPSAGGNSNTSASEQGSGFGQALAAALRGLGKRCVELPLTMQGLNARSWTPAQITATGRLQTASLQFASGSQLLVDETVLKDGRLAATGVHNLQALKRIIEQQKVEYDFGFYKLPQPSDAPVTILSEGRMLLQTLLQSSKSLALPLQPTSSLGTLERVKQQLQHPAASAAAAYVESMRLLDCAIEGSMVEHLQRDMAARRQADRSIDGQHFHNWLSLVKALAASHGESSVTEKRWQDMHRLEHLRQERL